MTPTIRIFTSALFVQFTGIILLTLFMVGCGEDAAPKFSVELKSKVIQNEPQDKHTIALVMKTLTNPFFKEMERGARRAEKDLGINLLVKTAAQETSIQQQIGIVADLIELKVDALVIAPGDSVELIPILKHAQDKGIIVINIDNLLDQEYSKKVGLLNVPFISVDNELAAYKSTKVLTEKLTQPTEVAIIEGIRGALNAELRKNGAIRAFSESKFATLVATESANWKIDEAFELAAKLYNKNPNIGAIFCANDMMALGVIEYLQSTGKDNVQVVAFDAIPQALNAVQSGVLLATVDQDAAEQGYQGILSANNILSGKKTPLKITIEAKIITKLE
ncbi:monosaccharide ABC transporter substrate-binding protein, CUT2 family [Psychromonas ingrahamii 37]|uniref:Monosaccharide ABC transporter substrate-binding protein, CUT2 family n=1 Tax=Psychromonas ingrahamii (strain DSM 17664 / CCUG 51855 / 37) TaxID=357804 RepID=A1STY3_PSYIN|nr:substrate-binding domain-containing protein [Psychromonas ingrahamii]ABM02948.1 monosaccharide ABC transporter substrate-binding protein, CUT2 family [Psychromonas ingrahamii 37]